MTESQNLYTSIGLSIENAVEGNLFGKPCFKIQKKAFVCFFQEAMVFKLKGDTHAEALALDGSQLFDPSGKGRPMKEWVQVPYHYKEYWEQFGQSAFDYVSSQLK